MFENVELAIFELKSLFLCTLWGWGGFVCTSYICKFSPILILFIISYKRGGKKMLPIF